MKWLFVQIIKLYKLFLSPLFGYSCRFYPTCSDYAAEAISANGIVKGSLKAFFRVLRCNPFSSGGYDPVSPNGETDPEAPFPASAGSRVRGSDATNGSIVGAEGPFSSENK